jgi:hypothetical protein
MVALELFADSCMYRELIGEEVAEKDLTLILLWLFLSSNRWIYASENFKRVTILCMICWVNSLRLLHDGGKVYGVLVVI